MQNALQARLAGKYHPRYYLMYLRVFTGKYWQISDNTFILNILPEKKCKVIDRQKAHM
jgi:hypothetical protein